MQTSGYPDAHAAADRIALKTGSAVSEEKSFENVMDRRTEGQTGRWTTDKK